MAMLWLFGQIWLWLLLSFLLGAVLTWVVLTVLQREKKAEPATGEPDEEPVPRPAPDFSEETAAERTQFIPAARFDGYEAGDGYDEEVVDEPFDQEVVGHREGVLPQEHGQPERANDPNGAEPEPAWPRPEDLPASEHRPGRGG
jgi:hypothetical protein